MNKIPNNTHQGPAASAASGVNKIGFWPAKDCLLSKAFHELAERVLVYMGVLVRSHRNSQVYNTIHTYNGYSGEELP